MMQETKPLISVLMGVHNCKSVHMLQQAVHSILRQTYRNLELIICDDGSDDNGVTWETLQALAAEDARIRLLRHERCCYLAQTLNDCMAAANGTYFARQDDDDISLETRLEVQMQFLHQHPEVDFVGTPCIPIDRYGNISGKTWLRPELPEKRDFLFNSPFIHGSVLYRKRCFERVTGYPIMENIPRYEDYMLFMQLYADGKQGANLQMPLYYFYFEPAVRCIPRKERMDEFRVRREGFRLMEIPIWKRLPYLVKPLVLAYLPKRLLHFLRECVSKGGYGA